MENCYHFLCVLTACKMLGSMVFAISDFARAFKSALLALLLRLLLPVRMAYVLTPGTTYYIHTSDQSGAVKCCGLWVLVGSGQGGSCRTARRAKKILFTVNFLSYRQQ